MSFRVRNVSLLLPLIAMSLALISCPKSTKGVVVGLDQIVLAIHQAGGISPKAI
jgi:hypothetical protein